MRFKPWTPIENLPREIYLEALHDDYEGFRLLLRGKSLYDAVLRVHFDNVLSYRNTDEGDLIRTLAEVVPGWCFYTVEDSTFKQWLEDERQGAYDSTNVSHYAIYTPNDCVDILTESEPIVSWLS